MVVGHWNTFSREFIDATSLQGQAEWTLGSLV